MQAVDMKLAAPVLLSIVFFQQEGWGEGFVGSLVQQMRMQHACGAAMEEDAKIHIAIAALLATSLVLSLASYLCLWNPGASCAAFVLGRRSGWSNESKVAPVDELEAALEGASMGNKTLIITVLNRAYAEDGGMLDLFLESLRVGNGTERLIQHILFVGVDRAALNRCNRLGLHCYHLPTGSTDLSKEELYMSPVFINMMWQRTLFVGQVLRRGYSFIFTDMDVLWLRNPFEKLGHDGEDMQLSCDVYNGYPFDESNVLNTGFYFAAANNRTARLFEEWYGARDGTKKEQDVLVEMKAAGAFRRLGMKVRFLDVGYFAGFCENRGEFAEVRTVHANCCRSVGAKLADLGVVLREWKAYKGPSPRAVLTWPQHLACTQSWIANITA